MLRAQDKEAVTMNEQKRPTRNVGKEMTWGILGGALVALIISQLTGNQAIWAWGILVGLSIGFGIGSLREYRRQQQSPKGATRSQDWK